MTFRILFVLLTLSSFLAVGQDRQKFILFETGYDFISCAEIDKDYLRADKSFVSDYSTDGYSTDIRTGMRRAYFGTKLEVRSKNDKFGFLSGLRFTHLNSYITKTENPEYFYLLYQQVSTTTEYLRIKELGQASTYLGVPLEVRWYPFKPRAVRMFFQTGAEFGFRLSTKNRVDFVTDGMEKYEDAVSEIVGTPSSFYSSFYGRAGITIGKEKPLFSLGVTIPVFISAQSGLTDPQFGGGFSLQIQKQL